MSVEPSSENALLAVADLTVTAATSGGQRVLVHDVNLRVTPGEAVALVGESGSGKSMIARSILQVHAPGLTVQGSIRYRGNELVGMRERELERLRGGELGMVFQDPFTMLSPTRRCGDQVVELLTGENGRPLRGEARAAEVARRLAEVGIDDPHVGNAFPGELSGGMRQRVGIAAALALDPSVLIADEPTTALDVTTQREILRLLSSLQRTRGMALVLITHDLRIALSTCDRVAVMYAGSLLEVGEATTLRQRPSHPYTRGLLDSEPPTDHALATIPAIPGAPAKAHEHLHDCAFAARCRWVQPACTTERPIPVATGPQSYAACLRTRELELVAGPASVADHARSRATGGPPVIAIGALTKSFRSARREVRALRGVDIDLFAGESVGIVGESGSGKSTLARCLMGLERPSGGTIRIGDIDASDFHALTRADRRRVRRTVQMVFQDPNSTLNPALSIGATLQEAARIGGESASSSTTSDRVTELLEKVGLSSEHARRRPYELSGGQRQRVAIARGLAVGSEVLVCDEATSALDVSVQAQILNLLNDLRSAMGISILFITHDLAVVRQVTDRVYVMQSGTVVEEGPTADVLDHPQEPYAQALVAAAPRQDPTWLMNRQPTPLED